MYNDKFSIILKIDNLKSAYDETLILKGVDIDVRFNEIILLIGPNGAGKSTVLKSIFSLTNIISGKILYKGKNITNLKTSELIKLGISYVPQGRQVFSNMSVFENLYLGTYLINDKNKKKEKVREVLEKFPFLKKKLNDSAASLSGGQQQILAIARAIMQDPQLLLMDEPSLGLSPKAIVELINMILKIKNEGTAVILVEQNVSQITRIVDRIYILRDGKIAISGNKDILKDNKVREIYVEGN